MNVTFLAEASREFLAASEYYDRQQPGLGQRFEEEVDRAVRWILEHSNALPLRRGVYRRLNPAHLSVLYFLRCSRIDSLDSWGRTREASARVLDPQSQTNRVADRMDSKVFSPQGIIDEREFVPGASTTEIIDRISARKN